MKKQNHIWVVVNNQFLVTRDVIHQELSLVTASVVRIIGESPYSWPKTSLFTATHM